MLRSFSLLLILVTALSAEQADWIWTARYVVTMDGQRRVIENGAVAILGDHIAAVGPRVEIERQYQAKQRLDRGNAVIIPGLIDTHTHVPMSLFRGIADDLRLQDWLQNYIFPAEARNVDREFVRWGTRLGCLEMMLAGVTTYTDMYFFEDTIAEVTREAGLRGVLGQSIIGFPTPDYKTPQDALKGVEKYLDSFRGDALIVPAVAPHAIYTTPDNVLKAAHDVARKFGAPLLIHLSETKTEYDEAIEKRGKTPVEALDALGFFEGGVTLGAHAIWLSENDRRILKRRGVGLAHCPSSNTKLASGVAPVVKILEDGIAMGLGTDGFAGSNNRADLMREMSLAAKLQKVTTGDPRSLNAETALSMATIIGARALGMEKLIGSLEAGKRADLVVLRLDEPHAVPLYNLYSQIVYALDSSDVRDVMVNGRQIVKDARSLTLQREPILAKAAEYRQRVQQSLVKAAAR